MMLSNDKDLAISHEDELATFFLSFENKILYWSVLNIY